MPDAQRTTYSRTSTSPAAGSGVSCSSILVEMVPGLSYTTALNFFGISNTFSVAVAAIFTKYLERNLGDYS